jgi:hypothetical protein
MTKYYLLDGGAIQEVTDKAYGIVVGSNNLHGNSFKLFIEWIPESQTIKQGRDIYVAAWLTPRISTQIHFDSFIEIETEPKAKQPRKTKEQKQNEEYNKILKSHFNDNIPNEYIEYYLEGFDTNYISNARFTTINKLQSKIDNEEVIKIVVVKNDNREVIRG